MPSINKNFLLLLQDDYTRYNCFIETGTLNGDTTFAMESLFKEIYTIELSPLYHTSTKERYSGNKINFLLGDSSIVLKELLPSITENTIFFLDGHWSNGNTAKGEKDCPLLEEITHITNLFKHSAIIIIDDYRLFGLDKTSGKLGEDWSQINKNSLLEIIQSRIRRVYHLDSVSAKDDRLIIHIGPIQRLNEELCA
jgi:hypothetical protein